MFWEAPGPIWKMGHDYQKYVLSLRFYHPWCTLKHCEVRVKRSEFKLEHFGSRLVRWNARACNWHNYSLSFYTDHCYGYFFPGLPTGMLLCSRIVVSCQNKYWRWVPWCTLFSLGTIPLILASMDEVSCTMSTAKSSTISSHTQTLNSSIHVSHGMVSSSEKCFFVALRRWDEGKYLMVLSLFCFRKAFLTRLSPATMSERQVYGCSCWAIAPCFMALCMFT